MASSSVKCMDQSPAFTDDNDPRLKRFFPSPCPNILEDSYNVNSAEEEGMRRDEDFCFFEDYLCTDDDLLPMPVMSTIKDSSSSSTTEEDMNTGDDEETDFADEVPMYSDDMMVKRVRNISENKYFDIMFLLRNKAEGRDFLVKQSGEQVSIETSLRGNYVLVCCFFIPLPNDSGEARLCRAMIAAYTELKAEGKNFEMVIVAKMHSGYDSKSVFDHFFKGFPSSCLAIPYEDSASRDYVCKSLDLTDNGIPLAALIVDPKLKVLQTDALFFDEYGADSFPFTDYHMEVLDRQDEELKGRLDVVYFETKAGIDVPSERVSLAELLQCNVSDKLSTLGNKKRTMSVSNLNKKLVGVYLLYDGSFMSELVKFYEKSRTKEHGFEIVLVPLAFHDSHKLFLDHVKHVLEDKYKISSWWALPFNNKVYRRLWRLCYRSRTDELIMLPPGDKSAELKGKAIMSHFGINAYPFTRESILDKRMSTLRSLTLESLLGNELVDITDGSIVPVSKLRGKKILFYLRWRKLSSRCNDYRCQKLLESCSKFLQVRRSFKLVIVTRDEDKDREKISRDEGLRNLPWLICQSSIASVTKLLFRKDENRYEDGTVVAIGKDGRILSREAQSYRGDGMNALFTDNVRDEIIDALSELDEDVY